MRAAQQALGRQCAVRNVNDNVFTDNRRAVCHINSPDFGNVLYVTVGASMVGGIELTSCKKGEEVKRGDEHGYFAFGGSSAIILFEPGAIKFDDDLVRRSLMPVETLIQVGDSIGTCTK